MVLICFVFPSSITNEFLKLIQTDVLNQSDVKLGLIYHLTACVGNLFVEEKVIFYQKNKVRFSLFCAAMPPKSSKIFQNKSELLQTNRFHFLLSVQFTDAKK